MEKRKQRKTISNLIMEYFEMHPREELKHGPVVDWVEEQYKKLYRKKPRDTWRGIRRLHQEGKLIKVKKGVYKYDPDLVQNKKLYEFPPDIKEAIFKRDNYRCVVCGRGREDGVEIHADHKIPLDKGGSNTIDNGQTLCSEHNFLKKNYSQTEFGKRFIIRLYEDAIQKNDETMAKFCKEILDIYDKYGVDSHIKRPDHENKQLT
ncbi:MAG: HNH endonuclease [Sulfurihydrogenibium sp.]|nr:HNH endonuclease [Sulfurihydrogenibium sp.]